MALNLWKRITEGIALTWEQVDENWADIENEVNNKAPLSHTHAIAGVTGLQGELDGKIPTTEKATPNGVATLGADGKVPDIQLPPFADSVSIFVLPNDGGLTTDDIGKFIENKGGIADVNRVATEETTTRQEGEWEIQITGSDSDVMALAYSNDNVGIRTVITLSANPDPDSTITFTDALSFFNLTFKSSAPSTNEVLIGATYVDTMTNLVAELTTNHSDTYQVLETSPNSVKILYAPTGNFVNFKTGRDGKLGVSSSYYRGRRPDNIYTSCGTSDSVNIDIINMGMPFIDFLSNNEEQIPLLNVLGRGYSLAQIFGNSVAGATPIYGYYLPKTVEQFVLQISLLLQAATELSVSNTSDTVNVKTTIDYDGFEDNLDADGLNEYLGVTVTRIIPFVCGNTLVRGIILGQLEAISEDESEIIISDKSVHKVTLGGTYPVGFSITGNILEDFLGQHVVVCDNGGVKSLLEVFVQFFTDAMNVQSVDFKWFVMSGGVYRYIGAKEALPNDEIYIGEPTMAATILLNTIFEQNSN